MPFINIYNCTQLTNNTDYRLVCAAVSEWLPFPSKTP